MSSRTPPLALALALAATAAVARAAPAGDKGGLVALDVPPSRLERAHAPRRIALVVGIQRFDDARWSPLRFPEADARALADVLAGAPTRDELRAALARLAEEDLDERDTVLVYFSSHGSLARDGRGELRRWLVARDTRLDAVAETGLGMDELKADFDRLRSRRKVLVLATCHSGAGKSLLPDGVQRELEGVKGAFFVRPIEEVSRASVVLAASDWGETAREDEKLGNDIYTHFLVEALRLGADRNGDGAVTASEAHDYARRMTYEYTAGRQRPSAESSEVGADPIVLVGKVARKGRPELYSYAARLDGFTVRVNGRPLADLPGGVALEPGRHRVQLSKGAGPEILDETLRLGPGERIELLQLVSRTDGRWEIAPRVSLLSFLDARSRRDVLGPVVGYGATASWHGWPGPATAVRLDVTTSFGRSRLRQGPFETRFGYSAVSAGVSVPWSFQPGFLGRASLLAGPRLSALWLDRTFDLALAPPAQSVLTLTPGLVAGVSLPLGRGLTAGMELQLDWALVRVDGTNRSSGLAELLVGAGWRF